ASNSTRANMGLLWEYLERYGRMVDVYTDRHSMFAVARRGRESEDEWRAADRLTQIGRALRELGIGWIGALSPQAKGRVERSFGTDQDRLVKLLRLAKVRTLAEANRFLEQEYWPEWNERFALSLEGVANAHRPLTAEIDLGGQFEPCRDAGDRQRLHDLICWPAVSDREAGCAGRDEAPEPAGGTAAGRNAQSPL
ncbi:MAG: hypothetical protein ACOYX1_00190, partial [Acidobacteriota bacterium]